MEEIIAAHGGEVLNSVPSVAQALAAIKKRRPDAVILDRNLDGEPTDMVAEAIVGNGIPFVVVSGTALSKRIIRVFARRPSSRSLTIPRCLSAASRQFLPDLGFRSLGTRRRNQI